MAAQYQEITRVAAEHDGLPVSLVLNWRIDQGYYCLSWRTRYPLSPSHSRRFYRLKAYGVWTLPVAVAQAVMRQAQAQGMLEPRYDWGERDGSEKRSVIDSRWLAPGDWRKVRNEVIGDTGEPDWGLNPLFVICHSDTPGWQWRDILLVDTAGAVCTFRGACPSRDYEMAMEAGLTPPWLMDNAMQDLSPLTVREFLGVLEEVSDEERGD